MAGWHHWLDGRESEWTPGVGGTGKPGVLRFMGSQRVGHNWATDLIWYTVSHIPKTQCVCSSGSDQYPHTAWPGFSLLTQMNSSVLHLSWCSSRTTVMWTSFSCMAVLPVCHRAQINLSEVLICLSSPTVISSMVPHEINFRLPSFVSHLQIECVPLYRYCFFLSGD